MTAHVIWRTAAGSRRRQAVIAGAGVDGGAGKSWPLIEGSGTIYGMFVIESLSQTKTEFLQAACLDALSFIADTSNG